MEKIFLKDIDKIDLRAKVIAFPTDTVYGVGCMVDDIEAINKIYEIKNRDYSKPLAILCYDDNISKYVKNVNDQAKVLMEKYWPGALTIIFKKSEYINNLISANLDTIGFRMPNSDIALGVLKHFGIMCTTSVNISGSLPLNNINDIEREFNNKIDYLVIDECKLSKVSSTVVDATGDCIKIIRQGDIKLN